MDRIVSHKDLVVWHKAVALACKVYAASRSLPRDERFGLRRQLRHNAIAVASLIAEGAASQSRARFVQLLHAARCSLSELETQLLIASQLAPGTETHATLEELAQVGRLLNGLIRSLVSSNRAAHAKACAPQR
jgi:four helix bundle protein